MLYEVITGTGPIKGFATTLIIGICTSLFSAIFITRLIFERYLNRNKAMTFDTSVSRNAFKNVQIKFIERSRTFYVISGLILLVSVGVITSYSIHYTKLYETPDPT